MSVRTTRRRLRAWLGPALVAVLPLGCGNGEARDGAEVEAPQVAAESGQEPVHGAAAAGAALNPAPGFQVVASGLEVPWDLAFAPDGRVFVTERPGRIRVLRDGALRAEPWAELDVAATGEAGLTAIAVGPDFRDTGHVFVLGTFRSGSELENRIIRLTDREGRGGEPRVVVDGMPADRIHAGSALDFGPDGLLYVSVGDATDPRKAQDPQALHGKLLRYRPDGAPAPGNGVGGAVHALGLRNAQGMDWHPAGALFASEHGPSGLAWEDGRRGDDELNRIRPGGNYGWPEVAGRGDGRFVEPLAVWNPAIAASGLAIYTGEDFPAWRGHAFLGALAGRQLRRVGLEHSGGEWRVVDQEALFEDRLGRIRAAVMAPDGTLWFTTSNRDGRGDPASDDDRILRLVPR